MRISATEQQSSPASQVAKELEEEKVRQITQFGGQIMKVK